MTADVFHMFTDLSSDFEKKYDNDPNFKERLKCWTAVLDKYIAAGKQVYDLGCGPGVFSFYAASKGANVTGIDGSEGMINLCRQRLAAIPGIQKQEIRFLREPLPLADTKVYPKAAVIICSSVFEYIENKEKMMDCFEKLLEKEGTLLISVPNRKSVYRFFERTGYHLFKKPSYLQHVFHQFTEKQLTEEFVRHGFFPVEKHYYASRNTISRLVKPFMSEAGYSNLLLVAFQKKN
jgi:2-polyprenyl-3-methyl-5-hydroxy-6-metoxy-1,4-benzoquinol methylase